MATYFDGLQRAQFARIEFPYTSMQVASTRRLHTHEYRRTNGGANEDQGRKLYTVTIAAIFDETLSVDRLPSGKKGFPGLYPDSMEKLRETFEKGEVAPLTIPTLGTIEARMTGWTQRTTPTERLSGETVDMTFIEDQEKDFLLDSLIATRAPKLAAATAALELAASGLNVPTNIFDDIQSIVDTVEQGLAQADMAQSIVAGKLEQVAALCSRVERAFNDPTDAPIIEATKNVWIAIVDLAEATTRENALQVRTYTVPRLMTIQQVSQAIYQTTERVSDLLGLNAIEDTLAIEAGTRIRYIEDSGGG